MEPIVYTYDEAYQASLEYFKGDELAARVWVNKYALKDSYGNIYEKTPDDMHWRIANEIARIEQKYPNPLSAQELFDLMKGFRYIVPQGSPMSGIGNNYQVGSLSNCFVIGLDGAPDYKNRRRASSINETSGRSRSRFVSYSAQRVSGKKLGFDFYGFGSVYGTLFQFHA